MMPGRRPGSDYGAGIEALVYLAVAQIVLMLPARLGLARVMRSALQPGASVVSDPQEGRRLNRVCEAAIRRWPLKALCLQRSLVLLWLLRRRGIESELKIGVRKDGPALSAHAWIEMSGEHLNDSRDHCAQFVPLFDVAESLRTLRRAELAS